MCRCSEHTNPLSWTINMKLTEETEETMFFFCFRVFGYFFGLEMDGNGESQDLSAWIICAIWYVFSSRYIAKTIILRATCLLNLIPWNATNRKMRRKIRNNNNTPTARKTEHATKTKDNAVERKYVNRKSTEK